MSSFTLLEDRTADIVDAVNYIGITGSAGLDIIWLFSSLLTITTETVEESCAAALSLFISIL